MTAAEIHGGPMAETAQRHIGTDPARARFGTALATHAQDFGTFLFAHLLGLGFAYLPAISSRSPTCPITCKALCTGA